MLGRVQLGGVKPQVLGLIIAHPLRQILHFSSDDMMLLYSLNFVLLFTIDFQWWSCLVQSVAMVASEEVDMKNVMKSLQCLLLAGSQVQMVSRLSNALQHSEGSNVAILKLPWAL